MKIKHLDLTVDIDKDNPFKNCKLDRERYAKVLTNIISSYSDGFVLEINNKWGTGKTTFVKMWEQSLKSKEFKTIYFNAWENDFENNPLTALIGELKLLITNSSDETEKKEFQNVLKKGALITKHAVPALIKAFLEKYIDTDSLKDSLIGLSEDSSGLFKEEVEEYAQKKKDIEEFRDSLSAFITETVKKKPLIFIVDELDRCRPDYAVSILEQIKHLFSIPNIVFVLSINKEQLGNAVRGVYGSDRIDADEYLRRFIDLEYSLPDPSTDIYYQYLYKYFKFDDFFQSEFRVNHQELYNDKKLFLRTCQLIFFNNNIPLRVQEKIFSLARASLRSFNLSGYIIPELFLLLVYIKFIDEKFYDNLRNKKLSIADTQNGFLSIMKHNKTEEYEWLLTGLEAYLIYAYIIYKSPHNREALYKYNSETKKDEYLISSIINENLNNRFYESLDYIMRSNYRDLDLGFFLDRIDLLVDFKS